MAHLIEIKTITDQRGSLNVIEGTRQVPFPIRRVFYMYDVPAHSSRGGHGHKKNRQALICLSGSCEVIVNTAENEQVFRLDHPAKCLLLEPSDWHVMREFSFQAVLMVLASEYYDAQDYIIE
jgi:dTDP-4-dehydrorhamnose 3,5-epimerase-like enzyme